MSIHQLDQAVFRPTLPEDIDWAPLPPPARLAVVVGRPAEPAPYVVRVKLPKSGAYVTQVTAIGPISLEYADPEDDPRDT